MHAQVSVTWMAVTDEEMAQKFNEFFCNIGPELASQIPNSILELDLNPDQNIPRFQLRPMSVMDVRKILSKISSSKATGADGVSVRLMKLNLDIVCPLSRHIINLSLTTLSVPSQWKSAIVKPLLKEGSRSDVSNYRPISILPACSKILEKLVHIQVYDYLSTNNILSKAQFRFRKRHSTTSCILSLTNSIFCNMEQGNYTGVVFLDLKRPLTL